MKRTVTLFLAIIILLPFFAAAQSLREDPRVVSALRLLEVWLEAQSAYENIPGLSMAVVYDQDLLWAKGFGYADREEKRLASPETIYGIGSISKLFTSIAVLQLRDQGKLRLDDPVVKHLPWFAIKQTFPEGPPITIHGILTHSSGLPRDAAFPYWSAPYSEFPTEEKIAKVLASQATVYPADSHFNYSNLGFALAGAIVARISGQSYDDYVKQNILVPLGLDDTKPELPEEQKGGRLATGYSSLTREGIQNKMPFFRAKGIAPAAGFSSTVVDLARFASWQFRLLEGGKEEILRPNTLREMQRFQWMDPNNTWGLGFTVWSSNGIIYAGHGGICAGYRSQLTLRPKEKIAAAFLTNSSGVNSWIYARRACDIVAQAVAEALGSPGTAKQPDPSLKKYEGTYSSYPWGGESAILIWKDDLAIVNLPTTNPLEELAILKRIDGNRFRAIGSDGEPAAEETIFEVDGSGQVTKLWNEGNFSLKVR
ncbi:MAG: serine hydrolase domain-containing protein [Candidatus Aminicenantales bacterium]